MARYGGEELVLLMPDTDRDQAEEVGQRMRQSIEQFNWSKLARAKSGLCGLVVHG